MQKLHLFVGETTAQVIQQNGFKPQPGSYDEAPLIWPTNDLLGGVFQVSYGEDPQPLILPEARLVWVYQAAGVVYRIDLSTSPKKQSVEQVYAELGRLGQSFRQAGWHETTPLPTLEQIRSTLAGTTGNATTLDLAGYAKGSVEAGLRLSAPGGVLSADTSAQPSFIAQISFQDQALERTQLDKMFNQREKVNGPGRAPLPLTYWLNQSNAKH